jgi:hypothetical protein
MSLGSGGDVRGVSAVRYCWQSDAQGGDRVSGLRILFPCWAPGAHAYNPSYSGG